LLLLRGGILSLLYGNFFIADQEYFVKIQFFAFLAACVAGCTETQTPTPPEIPAVRAMKDSISDCGNGKVMWQASRTNEPGVVWFTMRCEVQP
jgi:hypothetical protein